MDSAIGLTPSEIELLAASANNQPILFGNLTRKITDETSSLLPMLEHAFLTALQANEQEGNFFCQLQTGRSLFGIGSRSRVVIHVNGSMHAWPEPSLEASLTTLVQRLCDVEDTLTIAELIRSWLGDAAVDHLQAGLRWIFDAMAERGWVERQIERRLDLFRLTRYDVPEAIKDFLAGYKRESVGSAQQRSQAHTERFARILEQELDRELRRLMLRP